jgi:hypothetical protein
MGPPTVHLPLAFQLGPGALKSGAQELRTVEDPTPVSRRRGVSVPTYKRTRPAFRSRSTSRHRKLPPPASFGSCPQYCFTRRSTDPNQGHEVSTQKRVRLTGRSAPRRTSRRAPAHRHRTQTSITPKTCPLTNHSFTERNQQHGQHARDHTKLAPSRVSRTHVLGGRAFVSALPRDARRAGVHPRCPSAPPRRSR